LELRSEPLERAITTLVVERLETLVDVATGSRDNWEGVVNKVIEVCLMASRNGTPATPTSKKEKKK
jgi:hypothetical protein